MRFVIFPLALALLWTATPVRAQQPDDPAQAQVASLDPEALAAYLPETAAGWEQVSSEASRRQGHLAVAQGLYAKDGSRLQVVITDLTGRPPRIETGPGEAAPTSWPEYLAVARSEAEQGDAREVQYGDVLGFEGTGVSDDVVFPHGVMALPGRRFQVAVYEVREGLSSVADVKTLSEDELDAMLDRARALVQAIDLDGLASEISELEQSGDARADASAADAPAIALRSLLPETLDGLRRGEVQTHPRRPMARARYETREGAPPIEVQVGYGPAVQQEVRRGIRENRDEMETITHDGWELHLRKEPTALSVIAVPGETVLMIAEDGPDDASWDAAAARERLLGVLDALDVEQLVAFRMPDADAQDVEAAAGFETYAADWPSGRIALAYPEAWTLTDIHARTGWIEALSLTSSAEAADMLYGEGISMSTADTVRLVTPENAVVNVGLMGVEASGTSPLQILSAMAGSVVADAEVTQPPEAVTLGGTEAAMREVRGTDADGRAVVGQQWALSSGGQLVSVSVFLPADRTGELEPTLRTILESITVEPKE